MLYRTNNNNSNYNNCKNYKAGVTCQNDLQGLGTSGRVWGHVAGGWGLGHVTRARGIWQRHTSNVKKSNMLNMNEVHKNFNLTQWDSHTLRSILMPYMMITENLQKLHKICFGAFSMIFIFHLKIDLIVCEPDCVKLIFLWTSS